MAPPHNETRPPRFERGNRDQKEDQAGHPIDRQNSLYSITAQDLERVEDLHACWQWHRSLEYRLRLAKLRFEVVGLDADEQDLLAAEVAEFKAVTSYVKGCAP